MLTSGSILRFGSVAAWAFHIVACMGGCLGCDIRPKLNPSHDDPFKGQSNHASKQSQATLSDGFWTTSTYKMDNAAVQFCGSISSTNTLHQMHDAHGDGCSSKPSEFVNIGLILWNESRQKWIGNRKPESEAQQLREPRLSWNATYEFARKQQALSEIYSTCRNDRFSRRYLGAGRDVSV